MKAVAQADCNLVVGNQMVQCLAPGGLTAYTLSKGTAKPLREYHDSSPNVRRRPASLSCGADGCGGAVGRTADTKPTCRSIQSAELTAAKAASELASWPTVYISWGPLCARAYSRRMARQSVCRGNFAVPRTRKCNLAGNARDYIGNAAQSARLAALRMPPMIQINIVGVGCS